MSSGWLSHFLTLQFIWLSIQLLIYYKKEPSVEKKGTKWESSKICCLCSKIFWVKSLCCPLFLSIYFKKVDLQSSQKSPSRPGAQAACGWGVRDEGGLGGRRPAASRTRSLVPRLLAVGLHRPTQACAAGLFGDFMKALLTWWSIIKSYCQACANDTRRLGLHILQENCISYQMWNSETAPRCYAQGIWVLVSSWPAYFWKRSYSKPPQLFPLQPLCDVARWWKQVA